MADLNGKESSQSVKMTGADSTGLETNYINASALGEARTNDCVNNGAIDTVLNITTTASEGKVGGSRKTDRKYVWIQALTVPAGANGYILWGFSNTTQSFKLYKDQLLVFPIGDGSEIWFKTPASTGTVAFGEGS